MNDEEHEIIPPAKSIGNLILDKATEEQDYNDRQLARINQIDVIQAAGNAVAELLDIAKQSQDPKAFLALSNLISAATNANKTLLDMQISRKTMEIELDKLSNNPGGPNKITNNLVFNGTTTEFLEMLKKGSDQNKKE